MATRNTYILYWKVQLFVGKVFEITEFADLFTIFVMKRSCAINLATWLFIYTGL